MSPPQHAVVPEEEGERVPELAARLQRLENPLDHVVHGHQGSQLPGSRAQDRLDPFALAIPDEGRLVAQVLFAHGRVQLKRRK